MQEQEELSALRCGTVVDQAVLTSSRSWRPTSELGEKTDSTSIYDRTVRCRLRPQLNQPQTSYLNRIVAKSPLLPTRVFGRRGTCSSSRCGRSCTSGVSASSPRRAMTLSISTPTGRSAPSMACVCGSILFRALRRAPRANDGVEVEHTAEVIDIVDRGEQLEVIAGSDHGRPCRPRWLATGHSSDRPYRPRELALAEFADAPWFGSPPPIPWRRTSSARWRAPGSHLVLTAINSMVLDRGAGGRFEANQDGAPYLRSFGA